MATMMMATPSMQAQAEVLMTRSARWAKGTRSDGLEFYLFASSRSLADGTPIMNMCRRDGVACSCSGFLYRHICSHVVAVRSLNEQTDAADRLLDEYDSLEDLAIDAMFAQVSATAGARQAARFSRSYKDLFGPDED